MTDEDFHCSVFIASIHASIAFFNSAGGIYGNRILMFFCLLVRIISLMISSITALNAAQL